MIDQASDTKPEAKAVRIALLNPNTDRRTTEAMTAIARNCLPLGLVIEGRTVQTGAAMITTEDALDAAAKVVTVEGISIAEEGFDGIIIGGFGDPGLEMLRPCVSVPVVGIAEAAMTEAGCGGRRFSVVTVTPELIVSIRNSASRYGYEGQLASVRTAPEVPKDMLAKLSLLETMLLDLSRVAIRDDGAEAIVIGGGPLAPAAPFVASMLPIPIVNPVCAAVRLMDQRLSALRRRVG